MNEQPNKNRLVDNIPPSAAVRAQISERIAELDALRGLLKVAVRREEFDREMRAGPEMLERQVRA